MSRNRTRTPRRHRKRTSIVGLIEHAVRRIVKVVEYIVTLILRSIWGCIYGVLRLLFDIVKGIMALIITCTCTLVAVVKFVVVYCMVGGCSAIYRSAFGSKKYVSAPPPASFHAVHESFPLCPINKFSFEFDIKFLSTPHKAEPVAEDIKQKQAKLGPQSSRGYSGHHGLHHGFTASHKSKCFKMMVERERELAGEWCVMYHSYSFAAPLYEIHAAIAAILYGYDATKAPLPRLLCQPYESFTDARSIMTRLPPTRDHDIAWRRAMIAGSTSLYGIDPEATPSHVFENGYSCADLSFLGTLNDVLAFCGIEDYMGVGRKLIEVCGTYNLSTCHYGISKTPAQAGGFGHLLQIFVKRSAVDSLAYASMPFGVPDRARMPLSKHFEKDIRIEGQVRICANPNAFMRSDVVQLFHYCGLESFGPRREKFQLALQGILRPYLESKIPKARAVICRIGICPVLEDEEKNEGGEEKGPIDKENKESSSSSQMVGQRQGIIIEVGNAGASIVSMAARILTKS